MKNLSLDIQLIIECSQHIPNKKKIKDLISNIEDWYAFIDLAYAHGVFPLVYKELKSYETEIPQDVLQTMKTDNMSIVKQNMLMSAELIKVMKILEENNIEALAFKGPTLAQMAYGDITLRQYMDLDILVNKKDIYKTYKLLQNTYTRDIERSESQEKIWFKYAHDLGLTAKNNVHVEFHWQMLDSDHPINLENINFFQNTHQIKINNYPISVISNEEFLIYLCVHGSKHLYERLEWIVDIDRFINFQKIDWKKFDNLIEGKNYQKFVYLGLYMANFLFGTKIGISEYKNNNDIQKVTSHIFNLWQKNSDFTNKDNIRHMLKLFSSTLDKIYYIHKVYLKPTFTEYWYIDLPKPLYFLYYPLRQYLLMKKYFSNKNK